MPAKEILGTGVAGAATAAISLMCIAILSATLTGVLLLILFSAIWGATAGLLTYYVWCKHSRIVAYSLGFVGYLFGSLGFSVFASKHQLFERLSIGGGQESILFYYAIATVVGILAQVGLLLLLIALRQLWSMAIRATTARSPNAQDKADR